MNRHDMEPKRRLERVPFEGDLAQALRDHDEFDRDWKLLLKARTRLLREYPESWVACANGQFFHADTMFGLFRVLKEHGFDPGRPPREFLTNRKYALRLW